MDLRWCLLGFQQPTKFLILFRTERKANPDNNSIRRKVSSPSKEFDALLQQELSSGLGKDMPINENFSFADPDEARNDPHAQLWDRSFGVRNVAFD